MRKKNILGNKIKSIVTRVLNESKPLNEQFGIFCCEPGLCQCQAEFNPGKVPCDGNTAYALLADCQNDAGNCCTRWDCDPLGPGICYAPTVNNAAAPFASENDCLTTYPNGCGRTDNDYDCNQQTGNVCGVFVGGAFPDMGSCMAANPNGCPQIEDAYECDIPNCQCVVDVNGSFNDPVTALADCTAALSDPASECCCEGSCGEMFDCVDRAGTGPVCVSTPTGPFSSMSDCNVCLADPSCTECNDPVPEKWSCVDRTIDGVTIKVCVLDPVGIFPLEQDCLDCVADPACEVCNDPDPGRWDCVEDGIRPPVEGMKPGGRGNVQGGMPTKGGEKVYEKGMMLRESSANMICVPDANGPFMSEIDCIDCVADPLCPECNKRGTGGWDCTGSGCEPGGCTQVNGGQYSSFEECEEQTDDHYNLGFCDCCCPGQPQGCDSEVFTSPVMIHNGEYFGMHGQPFHVGNYDLDLNIAKDNSIDNIIIEKSSFDSKKKFEDDLVEKITQHNPSLICLAGFMIILSKDFVNKFKGKIINIHPSLLPKHKGLNTHEKAIISGDKYAGCTVHHVNERMDDGEIIAQQKVIITSDDTADTLKQKVLELEHKLYPKVIRRLLS